MILRIGDFKMKELLGQRHPQYGGIVTDIRDLPPGATFYVNNGSWNGVVIDENTIGVYAPTGLKRCKIDSNDPYFALSKIKYNNINKKK